MGTLRFAIEEKPTGKVAEHFKAASELNSLNRLKEYLCDAAVKRGKVKPDVCRNCGAGCRYGQKYVRLWDAQQELEHYTKGGAN